MGVNDDKGHFFLEDLNNKQPYFPFIYTASSQNHPFSHFLILLAMRSELCLPKGSIRGHFKP